MNLEEKIQNPICIKIGKDSNVILADEECKEEYPLIPGAMFGGEHFGFTIINDSNREQRECFYPTQCRIEAIGIESGILKIVEEVYDLKEPQDKDIFTLQVKKNRSKVLK